MESCLHPVTHRGWASSIHLWRKSHGPWMTLPTKLQLVSGRPRHQRANSQFLPMSSRRTVVRSICDR